MIIIKLIELRFFNYVEILLNIFYDKKLYMNNDKLINLLKRILIFLRSNLEFKYLLIYEFKYNEENKNKMVIFVLNEIVRINEELDVNFEGEDLKIFLNFKYLLEFI